MGNAERPTPQRRNFAKQKPPRECSGAAPVRTSQGALLRFMPDMRARVLLVMAPVGVSCLTADDKEGTRRTPMTKMRVHKSVTPVHPPQQKNVARRAQAEMLHRELT